MTYFKDSACQHSNIKPLSSLALSRCSCKLYIMLDRCAVYGCSNRANRQENISVFHIPFHNDERPEAKRRRKCWVDFVKLTRDKWVPTAHSAICSNNFSPESYEQRFGDLTGQALRLLRDDFGIVAFPTINTLRKPEEPLSERDCRMVSDVRSQTQMCFDLQFHIIFIYDIYI